MIILLDILYAYSLLMIVLFKPLLKLAGNLKTKGHNRMALLVASFTLFLRPWSSLVWQKMGAILLNLDKAGSAEKAQKAALFLDNKNSYALNQLGFIYQEREQWEESIYCFKRAIENNPHYSSAFSNLGASLQAVGDQNEAIKKYIKAINLRPELPIPYFSLGVIFEQLGEVDFSLDYYQKFIRFCPANQYDDLRILANESITTLVEFRDMGFTEEIFPN